MSDAITVEQIIEAQKQLNDAPVPSSRYIWWEGEEYSTEGEKE